MGIESVTIINGETVNVNLASVNFHNGVAQIGSGAPFLTDWSYRKAITLSRVFGAVSNYQMKLIVGESAGSGGPDIAPHNMTSNSLPIPFVASASSVYSAASAAWKAFENNAGSNQYWLGTGGGVDWLKIDIGGGNGKRLFSYSIRVNTIPEAARAPKNWTFQGSNNDSDWTTLDTVTNETAWGSGETRNFVCDAPSSTPFRYFRLNITANNGDATYTQVAELYLYGNDANCEAHSASDFDDIRFTTSDGETLLDYWIESITGTTPNQLATIWIEFDSIGTDATTFYMYYGNAAAPAVSNGTNTFIKFDDIEWGNNGDNLNTSGGSVTWTTENGVVVSTEQDYTGIAAHTRSAKIPYNSPTAVCSFDLSPSASIALRIMIYKEDLTNTSIMIWGNGTKRTFLSTDASENLNYLASSWIDTLANVTPDAWNIIELRNVNHVAGTYDICLNDALIKTGAAMNTSAEHNGLVNFIGDSTGAGRDVWLDNIIVRQYLATEPAWGVWGDEEIP